MYKIETEGLGLRNIGGPELELQFSEAVSKVAECFADDTGKFPAEKQKASIKLTFDFEHHPARQAAFVKASLEVRTPAYRQVIHGLHLRGEELQVEVDNATQESLFSRNREE